MSWAKLDDRANEHEKQVAAGAKACWLWACGLMYCNRQAKKLGRIPKTIVESGMLFPGLGKAEAKKLVEVELWHDGGDAYVVHEFHGWNPELREKRAEAGREGGKRSGEAKREAKSKQLATDPEANDEANAKQLALDGEAKPEAKPEARAQTPAYARTDARRIHPTPPHPTDQTNTTTQDPAGNRAGGGGGGDITCPKNLRLTEDQRETLVTSLIPPWAIDILTARYVSNNLVGSNPRPFEAWLKCLSSYVSSEWNNPRHRPQKPEPELDEVTGVRPAFTVGADDLKAILEPVRGAG